MNKLAIASLVLGVLSIALPFLSIFSIIFGFIALGKIRKTNTPTKGKGAAIVGITISLIMVVTFCFISFTLRSKYGFYRLPMESMEPTINKGDRFMVDKLIYKNHTVQRGDVIAFRFVDKGRKRIFVKRVIALPGETVEIKHGRIFINGERITIPGADDMYYGNAGEFGKVDSSVKVDAGKYYVLGDNYLRSLDSRFFGYIPKEDIVGKVDLEHINYRDNILNKMIEGVFVKNEY